MRILVQIFHVGMRGSTVEVEVIFFDVLAMIAFVAVRPKDVPSDRVMLVPERH